MGILGHPFFRPLIEVFLFNFEKRIIHVFPHNFLLNKDKMLRKVAYGKYIPELFKQLLFFKNPFSFQHVATL